MAVVAVQAGLGFAGTFQIAENVGMDLQEAGLDRGGAAQSPHERCKLSVRR
jgi:hypothetical protein